MIPDNLCCWFVGGATPGVWHHLSKARPGHNQQLPLQFNSVKWMIFGLSRRTFAYLLVLKIKLALKKKYFFLSLILYLDTNLRPTPMFSPFSMDKIWKMWDGRPFDIEKWLYEIEEKLFQIKERLFEIGKQLLKIEEQLFVIKEGFIFYLGTNFNFITIYFKFTTLRIFF